MRWVNTATGKTIEIFNEDCIPAMESMKENEFELAIVDPPYGIGESSKPYFGKKRARSSKTITKNYIKKDWDKKEPPKEYHKLLLQKSKNRIVWGVNNYSHWNYNGGRIFWDKIVDGKLRSHGELAFQSFNRLTLLCRIQWNGMLQHDMKNKEERIHSTQKPVALYKWLLKNYAKPNDRILDTHLGSGSIAIACWDMGFDLVGYEIDKDYFEATCKRLTDHFNQQTLGF